MAKKKKKPASVGRPDPAQQLEQLQQLEQPAFKTKVILQIVVAIGVVWLIAGLLSPYISYWGYVIAGILTAIVAGLAFYVWRLMKKSSNILDIMKGATDDEGRAAAIAALQGQGDDAMAKMAQAQLVAAEDPKEAMAILESIDIEKASKLVQNDIRAQLGLMYLINNRVQDARQLANDIKLGGQAQPKQTAMYVSVMAESFARTGKEDEAAKLLEDYDPENPEYAEVAPLLYRAQVYTWLKKKKKGRARTAMMRLARRDPNQLGPFVAKGAHPEVSRLAKEVLQREGLIPQQRTKMRMR